MTLEDRNGNHQGGCRAHLGASRGNLTYETDQYQGRCGTDGGTRLDRKGQRPLNASEVYVFFACSFCVRVTFVDMLVSQRKRLTVRAVGLVQRMVSLDARRRRKLQ